MLSPAVQAEISVIDDTGTTLTLQKPAQRIISLSPGLTELIFSAGGGELLKGVVSYSDFPDAAKKITNIGNYNAIDLEKILSLNPDLIVAWETGSPPLQISKLRKLGFNIYISEPREFDDISSTILRLGKLMQTEVIAKSNSDKFQKKLQQLKLKYPKNKTKTQRVFIQIWDQPLMSINGDHLISKIVHQCNGENIFSGTNQLTLTIDIETVLKNNPDIIIATKQGKLGDSWLNRWKQWHFLAAVKNNTLYKINPDHVVRHTPRVLKGIEQVSEYINMEHS